MVNGILFHNLIALVKNEYKRLLSWVFQPLTIRLTKAYGFSVFSTKSWHNTVARQEPEKVREIAWSIFWRGRLVINIISMLIRKFITLLLMTLMSLVLSPPLYLIPLYTILSKYIFIRWAWFSSLISHTYHMRNVWMRSYDCDSRLSTLRVLFRVVVVFVFNEMLKISSWSTKQSKAG